MILTELNKYCNWYKEKSIYEIEFLLEKDNVSEEYSRLFKALCRGTFDSEFLSELLQLKKMTTFFLQNGSVDLEIYQKRLEKIQQKINRY